MPSISISTSTSQKFCHSFFFSHHIALAVARRGHLEETAQPAQASSLLAYWSAIRATLLVLVSPARIPS